MDEIDDPKYLGGTPLTQKWDGQNRLAAGVVHDLERRVLDRGDSYLDIFTYARNVISKNPGKKDRPRVWRSIAKTARDTGGLADISQGKHKRNPVVSGLRLRTRSVDMEDFDTGEVEKSEPVVSFDYVLLTEGRPKYGFIAQSGAGVLLINGHALLRCAERGVIRCTDDLLQAILDAERGAMAAAVTGSHYFAEHEGRSPANDRLQVLLPAAQGAFIAEPMAAGQNDTNMDRGLADTASVYPPMYYRHSVGHVQMHPHCNARTFLHDSELDEVKRDALERTREIIAPLMVEDDRTKRRAIADTLPDLPMVEYSGKSFVSH